MMIFALDLRSFAKFGGYLTAEGHSAIFFSLMIPIFGTAVGEDPRLTATPELGGDILDAIVVRLATRVERYLAVGHE